jgi:hypothetical protein
MKVWEKLSEVERIGYNREMVIAVCKAKSRCPASIEAKYNLIGNSRLEKFCEAGCSLICVDEYADCKL